MPDKAGKKIGLLGGSFNPPHEGHISISEQAIQLLGLDELWWLVSPQNPLKAPADNSPLEQRLLQAKGLVKNPKIMVTSLEKELGTTYSIDTIKSLKKRYSTNRFIWLIGADNLKDFHLWKSWEEIFSLLPIAVLDRTAYSKDAMASKAAQRFIINKIDERNARELINQPPPAWCYLKIATHDASSTALRNNN